MFLQSLHVYHLRKRDIKSASKPKDSELPFHSQIEDFFPHFFQLETCQRFIWIGQLPTTTGSLPPSLTHLSGQLAYDFLLRVTCGLESAVKGETDVFGQFKTTWKLFEASFPVLSKPLRTLMRNLFEDTKCIRTRYLQGVGGASYASLARKILPMTDKPILTLGAGQLTQSLLPLLRDREVLLWNRTFKKAEPLLSESHVSWSPEPGRTLQHVGALIICTPHQDTYNHWIREALKSGVTVIHMGVLRAEEIPNAFDSIPTGLFCLKDLFALQESQNDIRSLQIERALRACEEKSLLRSMGDSITIPHGWEDLPIFQTI